ncbi:MAG: glycosyltransferase family 39 protein, partial [Chloroflexi bacterium]|nr:glycosyltransferase family 39 protein [Chloroflexota bacterium]
RKLPLMVTDRESALTSYLVVPFFWLFGVGTFTMRLMPVLGSALTLVLSYFLGKALFGRPAGVIAALLLATTPSYIFFSRQGLDANTVMAVMSTGSLLCLLAWHRHGQKRYLWLAALLVGLGIAIKILFLWYVAAIAVLALLFHPTANMFALARRVFRLRLRLAVAWPLVAAVPFLAIGAWMPIYYNVRTHGTWTLLRNNLSSTADGVNNAAYIDNLRTRIEGLTRLLDGGLFWYLGGVFRNPVLSWAFGGAILLSLLLMAIPGARRHWRPFALIVGLIAVIMLLSPFSTSNLTPTHLFILFPLPQLLIGASLWAAMRYLPIRPLLTAAAVALVALLAAWNVRADIQYHQALARSGGILNHSDAIGDLARYLDAKREIPSYSMDWGIRSGVQLLTQGRVDPLELFMYAPEPNQTFKDWTWGTLGKPEAIFIFHSKEATTYARYDAFLELAKMRGRTVQLEYTARQHDNIPIYQVYLVR